jgi:hypothetical protein
MTPHQNLWNKLLMTTTTHILFTRLQLIRSCMTTIHCYGCSCSPNAPDSSDVSPRLPHIYSPKIPVYIYYFSGSLADPDVKRERDRVVCPTTACCRMFRVLVKSSEVVNIVNRIIGTPRRVCRSARLRDSNNQ